MTTPQNPSTFSPFAEAIRLQKYAHDKPDGTKETWADTAKRVAHTVLDAVDAPLTLKLTVEAAIRERKFIPGGRYLYGVGKPFHQVNNCLLLRAEDSREGWAEHLAHHTLGGMTGAGMGTVYSALRPEGAPINGMGGVATGPIALMKMTNEAGRGIVQGGSRRIALWAGLHWNHPDILKFVKAKDWPKYIRDAKAANFNAQADLDMTNISVILDDEFFEAYTDREDPQHLNAREVYAKTVRNMLETGEPGFSVDVRENAYESLRNPCCEITSHDDSDVCCLGSINLARVNSLAEMQFLVNIGTAFLLAGTVYSDMPYEKVRQTREKNRRLGLGVMGVHEWLLARGKAYGPDEELGRYLKVYQSSDKAAEGYANLWKLNTPVKTRAIAPTGSIGILAETTTGIEPIFCVAYKRRYLDGQVWKYQYVVDPTAQKLVNAGVKPDIIEDAYSLAADSQRRVAFQVWMQEYVDHAISSTINLPAWGTEFNNEGTVEAFGEMLMKHLPNVRGITVYPDGARSGQPLHPVKFETAAKHPGQVFFESADICDIRGGGSCGS